MRTHFTTKDEYIKEHNDKSSWNQHTYNVICMHVHEEKARPKPKEVIKPKAKKVVKRSQNKKSNGNELTLF